jgi:cephalosporin hydroxylase
MGLNTNYKGFEVVHEKEGLPIIENVVKKYNPELIIELGYGKGGLTYLFHKMCPKINIFAFEKQRTYEQEKRFQNNRKRFGKNVKFIKENILTEPSNRLIELCKDKKRKILYCDNGNKVAEFHIYGTHLNSGDLIGVHDWGKEIWRHSIADIIEDFRGHEINKELRKRNCSTRFFIKR